MKKDYLLSAKKTAHMIRILCTGFFWFLLVFTVLPIPFVFIIDALQLTAAYDVARVILQFALPVFYASFTFIVSAGFLIKLLQSVEEGEPFSPVNEKRLRAIGVTMIVGSFFKSVCTSLLHLLTYDISGIDLHAAKIVTQGFYSNMIAIDYSLLICGFLVLVLSFVFRYGSRLQREHDQTV